MKEEKTPEEIQLELNKWLSSIHKFGSIRQFYALEESYKDADRLINSRLGKKPMYPEDYNMEGIGDKSDSDVFFKKINAGADDISDLLILKKYLTDDELKERLTPDSYMYIQTDELANKYVLILERKELERQLQDKLDEIEALKKEIYDENYLSERVVCRKINNKFRIITDKFTNAEYKFLMNKQFNTDKELDDAIEDLKNTRKL